LRATVRVITADQYNLVRLRWIPSASAPITGRRTLQITDSD
jgi:hypothetical protein